VIVVASFQEYLPLDDLAKILAVCVAVAVIAPCAAALVITGFEAQANAHEAKQSRFPGDLRIALGVVVLATLIGVGILALAFP
jgi:hypothetical protein